MRSLCTRYKSVFLCFLRFVKRRNFQIEAFHKLRLKSHTSPEIVNLQYTNVMRVKFNVKPYNSLEFLGRLNK